MKLYSYYRSSTSYRVRIALNLKGCTYEQHPVHLGRGEQGSAEYQCINPQGMVPALDHNGRILTQSLAIIDYLDEIYPDPALLPMDPEGRARVRMLAHIIAMDIHPIDNLPVLKYLTHEFGISEDQKLAWYRHWVSKGFTAFEAHLASSPDTGSYCHGDTPSLADICLVPQVYNAKRFDCDLSPFPTLMRVAETARAHPAFQLAHPSQQADSE